MSIKTLIGIVTHFQRIGKYDGSSIRVDVFWTSSPLTEVDYPFRNLTAGSVSLLSFNDAYHSSGMNCDASFS